MKKLIILLSLVFLFIITFSCSDFHANYFNNVDVNKGSYCTIDLNTDPAFWCFEKYERLPDHADLYQLDSDPSNICHVFYYKPDTSYIGEDEIVINFISSSDPKVSRSHYIYITVVEE